MLGFVDAVPSEAIGPPILGHEVVEIELAAGFLPLSRAVDLCGAAAASSNY